MITYPREIDWRTETPDIGDKVEVTYRDGTVTTFVVAVHTPGDCRAAVLSVLSEDGYGYSCVNMDIDSIRILVKAKKYKAGDILSSNAIESLPVGSIIRKVGHSFDIVVTNRGAHRYMRVDGLPNNSQWTWPSFTEGKFRLKYINE